MKDFSGNDISERDYGIFKSVCILEAIHDDCGVVSIYADKIQVHSRPGIRPSWNYAISTFEGRAQTDLVALVAERRKAVKDMAKS